MFSSRLTSRPFATRAAFACCALACAFVLGGCSQSVQQVAQMLTDGIEADVAQLTSLSSADAESLFASDYTSDLVAAGVDPATVYGPMFSDLKCEVSSVSIENGVATVEVTVTNKDLNLVLQNYTAVVTDELATAASREALASVEESQLTAHFAGTLVACLNDPAVGTVTTSVQLVYVQDGGKWVLQNADSLATVLLGGMTEASASNPSDQQLEAAQGTADAALQGLLPGWDQPAEGQAE